MHSKEIRQKFLDFFKSKKHAIIPGASLMPENDPTVLFTTAGMHPLVPYFSGQKHPEGKRLVDVQKCLRTVDIDEVGDKVHHTFFEMLGNWSLGDYFKKESLGWSFEFLTGEEWLGLDKNLIAASVFEGNENIPFDQEAHDIWVDLGLPEKRIVSLKDNWWGPAGETGPCGPDSEIFYWTGDPKEVPDEFDSQDDRWVEIWNNVFLCFDKQKDGSFKNLKQRNIDTGMGLERALAVVNGIDDNYRTDLFEKIIREVENLSGLKYGENEEKTRAMRVVADHIRSAVFVMADHRGISPSNIEHGYVVRRLLRRSMRYGRVLNMSVGSLWTSKIARIVIDSFKDVYPELSENSNFVLSEIEKEEEKFGKTLERGLKEFEKIEGDEISGEIAFDLYQTYGFPIEMTRELAKERGMRIDESGFEKAMEAHQDMSRTAAAGKFKSGLADHGEQTTKYHTATHLLLAALRNVLGDHVLQRGSNITAERLRFDFSHSQKLTEEEKAEVERLVNMAIEEKIPVICEEMTVDEAKKNGAMGIFGSKYGERVKVYSIGETSKEICAGPHVKNTGDLGRFKIVKEESSGSGVRRIKGVLIDGNVD